MTLAWIDATTGASGDMLLGALVAAGAPLEPIQSAVDALGVEPIRLTPRQVSRAGLAATKVDVACAASQVERTFADIRALLSAAPLPPRVRDRALDVFTRLAVAEAAAHGIPADDVHFHEVGALDSIADVVGVCAAVEALGIDEIVCSVVGVGSGSVRTSHGVLPVPVPAVVSVLAAAGAPVAAGPLPGEGCTPTAAALLASLASSFGPLPPMRMTSAGVGAGERDPEGVPNVVRVLLGEPVAAEPSGGAVLLESNVDDLDPRLWPGVLSALLSAGASDAWLTPILMKKGRPAHTLSVLVAPERVDVVRRVVFTETSTIGLREQRVGKHALDRELRSVSIEGQPVRVKVAMLDGEVVNAMPEYEDVVAAAAALGRPVKAVLAAAVAAAERLR